MWGTLDEPEKILPKGEFFCKNRTNWMPEIPGACFYLFEEITLEVVTDSVGQEYFTKERSRSNECHVLFNTEFRRYRYPSSEPDTMFLISPFTTH